MNTNIVEGEEGLVKLIMVRGMCMIGTALALGQVDKALPTHKKLLAWRGEYEKLREKKA